MLTKNKYMRLAMRTAFDQMGKTSPNPAVGAVIVRNGEIVSRGGTCAYGGDHAEITAIKSAIGADRYGSDDEMSLKGCEMFVSLEPCSHFGKTPPCTDAIIRTGISKVYIPLLDPNPQVAGRGVARLRDAGVAVEEMDKFEYMAMDLIRPFKKLIQKKRPYIINKSAVTLDGRIATLAGDSKWISSEYSRYVVHRLRARVDAVIIGKNTFLNDNPSLNVRLQSFDKNVKDFFTTEMVLSGRDNFFISGLLNYEIKDFAEPLRVLVGLPDSVDMSANFFADSNYLIFEDEVKFNNTLRKFPERSADFEGLNICVIKSSSPADYIDKILEKLMKQGVMLAMLEGGGRLSGSFFDAGAIDQFMYFIAPKVAGNGLSPMSATGSDMMSDSLKLKDISTVMIGEDILYNGYR